jgi:maltose alpha-D-glucosyltransferase/alpha-amylase
VLAFIRRHHDEQVLVVVNLSRYSQMVELDLARHAGCVPEEIFSRTPFAIIRDTPYVLTLGGYGFYLFALKAVPHVPGVREERAIPDLGLVESWDDLFRGKTRLRLEREVLPDYLRGCRWFGGASKTMQQLRVVERVAVGREPNAACLALLEAQYTDGPPELYGIPLAFGAGDEIRAVTDQHAHGVIARLKVSGRDGILYDAVYGERFRRDVLALVEQRHRLKGAHGDVTTTAGPTLRALSRTQRERGGFAQVLETDPRHTVIVYANTLALKLYRRLDEGISSETEIARFLTEERSYPQTPPFAGAIEYRRPGADPISLAWLQGFVTSQGDAWRFTVDEVVRYLGRVLSRARDLPALAPLAGSPLAQAYQEMPPLLQELIGGVYLELVAVLGRRTAELHHALSSSDQAAFAPEPFTALYQRSVFQSMQTLTRRVLHTLKKAQRQLPDRARDIAAELLAREDEMVARLRAVLTTKLTAVRIRIHGDYHLGRVLYTGNDFIVRDFEGDPTKPFSERRFKRSPLRDVADMLRSFQDASSAALAQHTSLRREDLPLLEPWADRWHRDVGAAFLRAYCEAAGHAAFLPKDWEETDTLLNAFLLTKAVADVGAALTTRPEGVTSALRAIAQVLDIKGSAPLAVEIQNAYPSGVPNP